MDKSLNKTLHALRCEQQKYQGGIFVENHVHKLLQVRKTACPYILRKLVISFQPESTDTLCSALVLTGESEGNHMTTHATAVTSKFNNMLNLFEKCHRGYRNVTSQSEVNGLGKKI